MTLPERLGFSSDQILPIQIVTNFTWLLLLFMPRWRRTRQFAIVVPAFLSVLWVILVVRATATTAKWYDRLGNSAVVAAAGVVVPDVACSLWLEGRAGALLVGLAQVWDSQRVGVPRALVIASLLVTMRAWPAGFLLYLFMRIAVLNGKK